MALIARIFVVIFAFLAACVAAAAVLMGGFLLPEWNDLMGAADIPESQDTALFRRLREFHRGAA